METFNYEFHFRFCFKILNDFIILAVENVTQFENRHPNSFNNKNNLIIKSTNISQRQTRSQFRKRETKTALFAPRPPIGTTEEIIFLSKPYQEYNDKGNPIQEYHSKTIIPLGLNNSNK